MAANFNYTIQVEFISRQGDIEQPFLLEEVFTSSVDINHKDYKTGKQLNEDSMLYETLEPLIYQYCYENGINVPNDIEEDFKILNITIDTEHPEVEAYLRYDQLSNPFTKRINIETLLEEENKDVPANEDDIRLSDLNINAFAYYRYSQLAPLPPKNVITQSTSSSVTLTWEDQSSNESGFRIYNRSGSILATVDANTHSWRSTNLVSNERYTYYVSSFNEHGESTQVQVYGYTDPIPWEEIDPDFNPADREKETIYAFQSGIGDNQDLEVVTNKDEVSREVFSYTMQVKGYEEQVMPVYPKRYFQYKFIAKNANGDTVVESPTYEGQVDGGDPLENNGKVDMETALEIELLENNSDIFITVEKDELHGDIDANGYPIEYIKFRFQKDSPPTTAYTDDIVTFFSGENAQITDDEHPIRLPVYGAKSYGSGNNVVYEDREVVINDTFPNPQNDPIFDNRTIKDWELLVVTENPNVELQVLDRSIDFNQSSRHLYVQLGAKIKNPKQTSWHPLIHNGYYYINQAEYYLYSESEVKGAYKKSISYAPYQFTYSVNLDATITRLGQEFFWVDTYKADFDGQHQGTTVERYDNDLTLEEGEEEGYYVSDGKELNYEAEFYEPISWDATENEDNGTTIAVYTSSWVRQVDENGEFMKDENGNHVYDWNNWREATNEEPPTSPLSKQIRYRIDMRAGQKKMLDQHTYQHESNDDFQAEIEEESLRDHIIIQYGQVVLKDYSKDQGIYTSPTIEMDDNIESFHSLEYEVHVPEDSTNAEIEMFVATQDDDENWIDAEWIPLSNVYLVDENLYTGEPLKDGELIEPKQYVRYQAKLYRGQEIHYNVWDIAGAGRFSSGQRYHNISIIDDGLQLQDVTTQGSFITSPHQFEFNNIWTAWFYNANLPAQDGHINFYTISADSKEELENVYIDDTRWVAVEGNTIHSDAKDYLIIKAELHPGTNSNGNPDTPVLLEIAVESTSIQNHTPSLQLVNVNMGNYYYETEIPRLHSIQLGGTSKSYEEDVTYIKSITSEILSDANPHMISDMSVEDIMDQHLMDLDIDQRLLVKNNYFFSTRELGITLTSRDVQDPSIIYEGEEFLKGRIFAQTTNLVEETIYDKVEIEVNENNEAMVEPIPKQGSPIIIQDASGRELTQVHFLDENGKPTLEYQEEIKLNDNRQAMLTYLDADAATLEMYYEDEDGNELPVVNYSQKENQLTFSSDYEPGDTIYATYKVYNSFYIDHNFDTKNNFAKIVLHNPLLNDDRTIKVKYETNETSPYYVANELDLNPIKNVQNQGFIYLTNKVEEAEEITLYTNLTTIFTDETSIAYIHAIVTDRYGNPVVEEPVEFRSTAGAITAIQDQTDKSGMVRAVFYPPSEPEDVIIAVEAMNARIQDSQVMHVKREQLPARLIVEAEKPLLNFHKPDEVLITAFLIGDNQEPLRNEPITFKVLSSIDYYIEDIMGTPLENELENNSLTIEYKWDEVPEPIEDIAMYTSTKVTITTNLIQKTAITDYYGKAEVIFSTNKDADESRVILESPDRISEFLQIRAKSKNSSLQEFTIVRINGVY